MPDPSSAKKHPPSKPGSGKKSTANRVHKGTKPTRKSSTKAPKIEIFTASFCPHCADAKFYMKQKKIAYTEYNLERSASAEKKFKGYGGKAVPLIVVGGKILRRWDQKAFEALYRQ